MASAKSFSGDEARRIGEEIEIDWDSAPFDVEQFRMGCASSWNTGATTHERT